MVYFEYKWSLQFKYFYSEKKEFYDAYNVNVLANSMYFKIFLQQRKKNSKKRTLIKNFIQNIQKYKFLFIIHKKNIQKPKNLKIKLWIKNQKKADTCL